MTRRSWVVLLAALLLLAAPGVLTAASATDPTPPVNQTAPAVTGTPRVGATLTASPGGWVPTPSSYTYAWLRDGVPVSGANAATYVPSGTDLGHRLVVAVTATGSGGTSATPAVSAPTAPVAVGRFTVVSAPRVVGVRRLGRTLSVEGPSWSPQPTAVGYRWLRDGVAIKGATKSRYTATLADFGRHLAVRVTASRTAYATGTAVSPATGPIDHRVAVRKRFTYSIATRGQVTASITTFARLAAESYADPRGWRAAGYEIHQVARGGDFTLVLSNASRMASFGYPCDSTWSCRVGRYVIINQTRWLHASPAWNAAHQPLRAYRHMVVNHETGHWLGHHHLTCPGPGKLAPIMMQQSKGLHGCRFNPVPLPSERWTTR
jgi:hypothetical protein